MTNPHDIPEHLRLYHNPDYFQGGRKCSGYDNYAHCRGVLDYWCEMLRQFVPGPITSVFDVGAAYGFVVDNFRRNGIPAWGIEPSPVALSCVAPAIKPYVGAGALPSLSTTLAGDPPDRFDLVTCTEVLEHVPETLVPESLQAMADRTGRFCVTLIMLEGPGADGDEGHICLKSREWWEAEWDKTGLVPNRAIEAVLNGHAYSEMMYWSRRLFVRERRDA